MAEVEGTGSSLPLRGGNAVDRFFNFGMTSLSNTYGSLYPQPSAQPSGQPATGITNFNQLVSSAFGQVATGQRIGYTPGGGPDARAPQPPQPVMAQQVAQQGQWPALFVPVAGVTAEQIRAQGSGFGDPRSGGRSHAGIDIGAPVGTPVMAAMSGTVVRSGTGTGGSGTRVWIRGDDGRAYFYAHLSSTSVQAGQRVTAGQAIGAVGHSGNASADFPHLHFSINGQVGSENPVADPWEVLTGAVSTPAQQSYQPTVQTTNGLYTGETVLGPDASDGEVRAYIKENFGAMSWAIDHDELGPLLVQAAREGWAPARLDAEIATTEWWRTTEPSLREWQALQAEDPEAVRDRIRQAVAELTDFVEQSGLRLSTEDITRLAEQSLALGWTEVELRDAVSQSVDWVAVSSNPTRSFGEAVTALRQLAQEEFMVPLSEGAAAAFAQEIFEGSNSEDGVRDWLRQIAADRFPAFRDRIEAGTAPATLFDSYRQVAAQTLEMDPEQVDLLSDPTFQPALEVVNDKGERRPMTLSEWGGYLRSLPEYRFTVQANEQAAEVTRSLGQMFGVGL